MATTTLATTVTKIRGRIDAVYYAGARFSAGRLITLAGNAISFAGKLYAREQDQVVLEGRWFTHPKYGHQLEVDSVVYDLELDGEGLAHYLAHHPDIKGIGPVKTIDSRRSSTRIGLTTWLDPMSPVPQLLDLVREPLDGPLRAARRQYQGEQRPERRRGFPGPQVGGAAERGGLGGIVDEDLAAGNPLVNSVENRTSEKRLF